MTQRDDDWARAAELEAATLRLLLERDGSKVLVVVVRADEGGDGAILRSVSEGVKRRQAYTLIAGLKHEIARIAAVAQIDPEDVAARKAP